MNRGNSFYPTPIFKLHTDILWAIFTINANMDADTDKPCPRSLDTHASRQKYRQDRALTTTRSSSQVCHEWRELIINSPSLWGKLIDLNFLDQKSDEWRAEILRRCRNSLLYLKGLAFSNQQRRFLVSVLEDRWEMVWKLDISVQFLDNQNILWGILRRPAPNLHSFHLSISHPINIQSSTVPPLFSHNAPLLREFRVTHFLISLQAPWLTNLRKLEMRSSFPISQLLETLKRTTFLESMTIFLDGEFNIEPSTGRLPSFVLDRLEEIKLIGNDFESMIAVLEHISPASGCSLSFSTDADFLPEDAATDILRTFTRYCRNYFDSHIPDSFFLIIGSGIQVGHRKYDPVLPFFSIDIETDNHLPLPISVALLDAFQRGRKFDKVLTLDLNLYRPLADINISWLDSAQKMRTDERALKHLLDAGTETYLPFPNLQVVEVKFLARCILRPGWISPHTLVPFLRKRRDSGSPIDILDLRTSTQYHTIDLQSLEEIKGLNVLIMRDGEQFGYRCGSRDGDAVAC